MKSWGKLIVLSGPSGVGKTTLCKKIIERRSDIRYSISATSRPMRRDEKNGREYFFLSEREFKEWIERGFFIECAVVHNYLYGTPKKYLEDNLGNGYHVIMDVDVQGAKKLMKLYPDGIFVFVIPPDVVELEKRLQKRNTDKNEEIQSRLATALEELKYKNDYKHVIENRDLEDTVSKILSIIENETNL
ncbi:MAG: guanylate kinase [candidate division WOR-3 bacterium]|nr:MAG: guanylate kinase [candidate division WOR-3 bacterium]